MKVLKVALAITLAVGLVLGVTLPGLANSDDTAPQVEEKPQPRMLKGKVSSVNATEELFTIQDGERSIDIKVNEGTRYFKLTAPLQGLAALRQHRMASPESQEQVRATMSAESQEQVRATISAESRKRVRATISAIPMKLKAVGQSLSFRKGKPFTNPAWVSAETQEFAPNLSVPGGGKEKSKRLQGNLEGLSRFGEEATFSDIAVGDRVIVRVVPSESEPLAKLVLIMKPSDYNRVIGEVTEITADTITIASEDGDAVELNYNGDTRFILCGTPYLEEGEKAVAVYVETDDGLLAKRIMQGCCPPELTD